MKDLLECNISQYHLSKHCNIFGNANEKTCNSKHNKYKFFTYSRIIEVHSEIFILSLEFSADKLNALFFVPSDNKKWFTIYRNYDVTC